VKALVSQALIEKIEKIIAASAGIALAIAVADTFLLEYVHLENRAYDWISTVGIYVFLIAATIWSVLVYARYVTKRAEMR